MPDVPDLEGMSVRELEEKLGEIDAEIRSIRRDTHPAGIGQLAELLEQKQAVQETLDRKRAEMRALGDPWKRPVPRAPDPEAPDFGWSTKKKATAVAIGAAVVAAVVAAIAVLTGGGSDQKAAPTTATQPPATTAPATSPTSDTTAVATEPKPVHFLVIRAHRLVTDVKLCGAGPQSSATGNWYFRLKGDPAAYEGKIAVLRGKGPSVAGTYRLAIHGGEVGMTKHLPCASPGTPFSIGLVSVGGRPAVQDGSVG